MQRSLSQLTTEQFNPNTVDIDQLDTLQIIKLIHQEDRKVAEALEDLLPAIAKVADYIVDSFRKGGRLFYIGAGSSGRLGILDAAECPPTFGTDPAMVQGLIAGGDEAIQNAVEGAEDSEELGARDIDQNRITVNDIVIGIAASGRTPYVIGAMKRAGEIGARVMGICNNRDAPIKKYAQLTIEAVVGPEAILGSTRMKSGTAQKLILNMLSTTAMIRMGKVYRNLMVDLNPSNEKLIYRSKRIIRIATEASEQQVEQAFADAGGHVKTAIVMTLADVNAPQARLLLQQSDGFVRQAVDSKSLNDRIKM
jgi:N-acetylmuramic acid 6-phosphate etherase